jgi:hypothetical protein
VHYVQASETCLPILQTSLLNDPVPIGKSECSLSLLLVSSWLLYWSLQTSASDKMHIAD